MYSKFFYDNPQGYFMGYAPKKKLCYELSRVTKIVMKVFLLYDFLTSKLFSHNKKTDRFGPLF